MNVPFTICSPSLWSSWIIGDFFSCSSWVVAFCPPLWLAQMTSLEIQERKKIKDTHCSGHFYSVLWQISFLIIIFFDTLWDYCNLFLAWEIEWKVEATVWGSPAFSLIVGGRGTCYDVNNLSCLCCSATLQLVGPQALLLTGKIFFQVQKIPYVLVKFPEFSCGPIPLLSSSWGRVFNTVTSLVSEDQRIAEGPFQAGSESKPVKNFSEEKNTEQSGHTWAKKLSHYLSLFCCLGRETCFSYEVCAT